jgi:phospholipase C
LPSSVSGIAGPLGLGFRVPMLVVSPFSRGGYVSSDTFDHTSQIRFLEARFGIKANLISTWRRRTVGNLTSTLHPAKATMTRPTLPSTASYLGDAMGIQGCSTGDIAETSTDQTPYPLPATQAMPTQEAGQARRLPRASH